MDFRYIGNGTNPIIILHMKGRMNGSPLQTQLKTLKISSDQRGVIRSAIPKGPVVAGVCAVTNVIDPRAQVILRLLLTLSDELGDAQSRSGYNTMWAALERQELLSKDYTCPPGQLFLGLTRNQDHTCNQTPL